MTTFTGFSEEDLKKIKLSETGPKNGPQTNLTNVKKLDKIGAKPKQVVNQYKLPILLNNSTDDAIDNLQFDKCKLSIRSPTSPNDMLSINDDDINNKKDIPDDSTSEDHKEEINEVIKNDIDATVEQRKDSTIVAPDVVRSVENYSEDDLATHKVKLAELQLQQRLMEEQNKKRKEMLAKALADRTKQTTEEVLRLEKIKKELQVLDGQFSQDVAVLRKKIDLACLSYADAEKHYLRVEREFLQAKLNLQKEKEKKELLTEHLCALITHNETRKAQKLETLMLELATDRKASVEFETAPTVEDDNAIIIDGVDQRTGKMVEYTIES